jgi:hypothetical protein
MTRFDQGDSLFAAVAIGAIAAFNLAPQPAQARHCSLVTATLAGCGNFGFERGPPERGNNVIFGGSHIAGTTTAIASLTSPRLKIGGLLPSP